MKGDNKENEFILPEMMEKKNNKSEEMSADSEWLEEQIQQIAISCRASRTKMERAIQKSNEIQVKLLQEFTDIVEWVLEKGTDTLRKQMIKMPDMLYQERECRHNVVKAWYAHSNADREIEYLQKELQNLQRQRMKILEYNDDFIQEIIDKNQQVSNLKLDRKWTEEKKERHNYLERKKRIEQSMEYAIHNCMITDTKMQQSLDCVKDMWKIIQEKVNTMAEEICRIWGIEGEKEAEKLYNFIVQQQEALSHVEDAWKRHRNIDEKSEKIYTQKVKTEEQDLRWMENIYQSSHEEARNL